MRGGKAITNSYSTFSFALLLQTAPVQQAAGAIAGLSFLHVFLLGLTKALLAFQELCEQQLAEAYAWSIFFNKHGDGVVPHYHEHISQYRAKRSQYTPNCTTLICKGLVGCMSYQRRVGRQVSRNLKRV